MNRSLSHKLSYIMLLFIHIVVILLFVGCQDDDYSSPGHGPAGGSARDVTFTLSLSGKTGDGGSETTRAMTGAEEEMAGDIHVLGFVDENNSGTYIYTYRAKAKTITSLSGGKVQFTVGLRRYDYYNQRFVVLANCEKYGNIPVLDGRMGQDNIDQLLPKLLVINSSEWKARNTSPGDPVDYIPMYAQSGLLRIDRSTTTIDGDAHGLLFIRMLARLDVAVQSAVTNFRLLSAELFNRKNMGYVAYKDANWNAISKQVTAADMPATNPGFMTTKLPTVVYPADATPAVIRSIYTFETKGAADKNTATAIVVGGYYDYPANQSEISYYRVDIPEFTAAGVEKPGTRGDLLRNHLYQIKIKKVSQRGAKTSEDAFNGAAWVEANIIPWNLADMDNIRLEGNYGLKVNKSVFIADQTGATNQELKVLTDYDEGWKATLVPASASSWVTVTSGSASLQGTANTWGTMRFDIAPNNTGLGRHAVFKIKAGGIIKYVDISQSEHVDGDILQWTESEHESGGTALDGPYKLGVSHGAYSFSKNKIIDVPLVISTDWPKGYTATAQSTGNWITITANASNNAAGEKELLFTVDENGTHADREGTITIRVGNLITKIITIKQNNIADTDTPADVLPWAESEHETEGTQIVGPYTLNLSRSACRYAGEFGGLSVRLTRSITVTATSGTPGARWTAKSSQAWVSLTTASGAADGTATTLEYTVERYNGLASEREAIITVTIGKMKKYIKITQYPGKAIEFENVEDPYRGGGLHTFTIKSKCPWVAQVQNNPNGVIEQLRTPSGGKNESGSTFEFSALEVGNETANLRVASADGEFEYYDQALSVFVWFELVGLYVYHKDQPTGSTMEHNWYAYANRNYGDNSKTVPPVAPQVSPARVNSCAAIPAPIGKPWRLPTHPKLVEIIKASWGGGLPNQTNQAKYGFRWGVGYWSADTNTITGEGLFTYSNSATLGNYSDKKSNSCYARCVRDK